MAARPPRPIALISGAPSGIGAALAARFAPGGYEIVRVARSADKLASLATSLAGDYGVRAWAGPVDLALRDAAQKLAAACRRKRRSIDVLVNNAGMLEQAPS